MTRYGPHDPDLSPTHVVEVPHPRGGWRRIAARPERLPKGAVVVDVLSPVLVRQDRQIAALARNEPLAGLRAALCGVCSRPEWECLTMRRGLDDPHEYEARHA